MLSPDSTTFDTSSTPTSADSMFRIFMLLTLSQLLGIWGFTLALRTSASKGYSSSSFSISTSSQSFEVHSHFMAMHWSHETTVGSQVEILSSFARAFSSTAEHFVYTRESSVQRSAQAIFVIAFELPSSTVMNALTTGPFCRIFRLLLHLDKSLMDMCSLQLLCQSSTSPIQTAADCSLHRDQNFLQKMSWRSCHRVLPFMSANRAQVIIPLVNECKTCQFLCFSTCL